MRSVYHISCLLAFVLCTAFAHAQKATDTINVKTLNKALVQQLFIEELNAMRGKMGLPKLASDAVLQQAAQDQANYCKLKSRVTHDQPENPKKFSPKQRVQYYGGNHPIVGENCLMTLVGQTMRDEKTQTNVIVHTYKDLAHRMFLQWKNSPGHYRNMVDKTFTNTGIAISQFESGNVVYATQVFACAPYTPIKNALTYSDTTYGVSEYTGAKCKGYGDNEFYASILANYLVVEGDNVYQYYYDEKKLTEIIVNAGDGIAIDLVYKPQFKCMEPDIVHPSTVFDGYMLPPVYRNQLFSNDVYDSTEQFMSLVGKMPPGANTKDLQINTILIQNGSVCRYSYPVEIEEGILPDIAVTPLWVTIPGTIKKGTADYTKTYNIPFEKNETAAGNYFFNKLKQQIEIFDGAITGIEITAYSSVEGSEEKNIALQNARTEFIESYIRTNVKQQGIPVTKASRENWDLFYKQVYDGGFKDLFAADTSKEGMRAVVNARMREPLFESWLYEQRVASITIHVHKEYDDSVASRFLPLVMYDGLQKNDTALARVAYSRLITAYKKGEVGKHFLTAVRVPLERKNLPLINNYLAAILLEAELFDYGAYNPDYFKYIDSVHTLFASYKPIGFNLSVYKTHLYFRDVLTDKVEFRKLESEILSYAKDTMIDKEVQNHLAYNYYLTATLYYRDRRMYKEMYVAFSQVKPYLALSTLQKEEVYAVGKYFNYMGVLYETIKLLEDYMPKYPNDEDMVYLYVTTGALYNTNLNHHVDVFYQQIDKLARMNRKRLCAWLNQNYQLVCDEAIEKKVCSYCTLQY